MRPCAPGRTFRPLARGCWAIMCIGLPTKGVKERIALFGRVPTRVRRRCRWKIMRTRFERKISAAKSPAESS